jgi:hypothetical protein
MRTKCTTVLVLAAIALLVFAASASAHQDVTLRDLAGNAIAPGSKTPYSPKQTCGPCHNYESDAAAITKQQIVAGITGTAYTVSSASHGVSAGYHFQQGLNTPWGNTQRAFYGLPGFTSSPGMYGKY